MTTGERIKYARKQAGLTQEQLAKKCGIATITVGQYERNKRQPSMDMISDLAGALRVSMLYLLGIADYDGTLVPDYFADPDDYALIKALNPQALQLWGGIPDKEGMAAETVENNGSFRRTYLNIFDMLNDAGKQKAIERLEELAEIPRYQRSPNQPDEKNKALRSNAEL